MKKLISVVIALAMILSLSVAAFAVDIEEDMTQILLPVSYETVYGTSPAITVGLTIGEGEATECTEGTEAPAIPDVTAITLGPKDAGETDEGTLEINLHDYAVVGKYTYPVTVVNTPDDAAGVTYSEVTSADLVVWVVNNPDYDPDVEDSLKYFRYAYIIADGEKVEELEYSYDAGDLTIDKVVTGNLGDKTIDFTFTVTLTAPEGTEFSEEYETEFTLKHGESKTITNIPVGTTWKVEETPNADYVTTSEGEEGTIESGDGNTCTFTNDRSTNIDEGVILESLPYVVIGLVVAAAVVLLIVRKTRKVQD